MRILFLITVLTLVVSCGKDGSNSELRQSQEIPDTLWDADGKEFKEAIVSVNASVSQSQVVFASSASDVEQGERIKCALSVNANETYHMSISGNTMYLQTNSGNYTLRKVNTLRGYLGTYSTVTRTRSNERIELIMALQPSHVVLRKRCEG